ncbi:DUF397 domain-containing protein [Spongiactinospora rosea]|uniref:DUF397 domain-containing protein n=1 Tax=Spongiactinospora rosea TaxID=2248750 RepID=A0A366M5D6_9ACTN|nr:DUF397 domain-containing protein [Spongiactinospora rosea]RBQ20759.1 DUF397 domain-containing protein [Spongiactinospora rosea]
MRSIDLSAAMWRKSSRSNGQANCVETAPLPESSGYALAVRDSKDPSHVLMFTQHEWRRFVAAIKAS